MSYRRKPVSMAQMGPGDRKRLEAGIGSANLKNAKRDRRHHDAGEGEGQNCDAIDYLD